MKPRRRRRKLAVRRLANVTHIQLPAAVKSDRQVKRYLTNILAGQF